MEQNIYMENILDHYKNPHNFGTIKNADIIQCEFNPLCGDKIEIFLKIKNKKISSVKFNGSGCAISQAAISMLTDKLKGKTLNEIKKLKEKDILNLLKIQISHLRLKCALLGLKAIQVGIEKNEQTGN